MCYNVDVAGDLVVTNNLPNEDVYEKINEWLDIYNKTKSAKKQARIKTLIILYMMPVVRKIAITIARRASDPVEDLVQVGFIGLLKAIDHYTSAKNSQFRIYAGYLIIGEIKHYLRDNFNLVKVPGYIQELIIRINEFTKDLTAEKIRTLTIEDYASVLDASPNAVGLAMEHDRRRRTISLEEMSANYNKLSYEELISGEDYEAKSEYEDIRIIFEESVKYLQPDEQEILDMYYKKDMSQREIADELGLSQMHVSRKMRQAFKKISARILEKTTESITR